MTEFLSEENIELHREYMRKCALRYSILEKSISGIKDKRTNEILLMKLSKAEQRDILALLPELELHRLYFESFDKQKNSMSACVRAQFGSEAAFLNTIYRCASQLEYGFVTVNIQSGKIECITVRNFVECFTHGAPVLAIDICEHAYFRDYGFDKHSYLVNALSYLKLNAIDKILK